jgi:O-acetyl-ADP-ribose deacetylase (regulator of RNase III)
VNAISRVALVKADITTLDVDAIVNAANTSLLGGAGVDGAIHRAAGPGLLEECRMLGGCKTGQAKTTKGHTLRARYVIHTVGPVWKGGDDNEDGLLASCYASVFHEVAQYSLGSVAFPSISTGMYGFPVRRAARIALTAIREGMPASSALDVTVALFDDATFAVYKELEAEILH